MKPWSQATTLLLILCMLVLLFLPGCSTSSPPSSDNRNRPPLTQRSGAEDVPRYLSISLAGVREEFPVNNQGELTDDVEIQSGDGTIRLIIENGTSLQDSDGNPVYSVAIEADTGSPPDPVDASTIGRVYRFSPSGVVSSRPIRLFLRYDPDSLPPGTAESDIYIACYGNGQWNKVDNRQIDATDHVAAVIIDHFCWYTALAPSTSSPTPAVSPPANPAASDKVDLLYFHPTGRCATCKYFEERTRHVITTYFQKETDSGQLTLTLYDYLDKANADLVKKYQVVGSQLFIRTEIDGVENIRNVWEIYQWGSNREAFEAGLRAIIQESLGGAK